MDPVVKPYVSPKVKYREYMEWIKKNSLPRKYPSPPPVKKGPRFNMATMSENLTNMSKPRVPYKKPKRIPYVNPKALTAVASARIIELAEPTEHHKYKKLKPKRISRRALKYVPTERILELSKPAKIYKKPKRKRSVKRKALKAKASKRIIEMAKPQIRPCPPINEFCNKVNPKALKYKATKRIIRLAKPIPKLSA